MFRLRATGSHLHKHHHWLLCLHEVLGNAEGNQPASQDQEHLYVQFQCRRGISSKLPNRLKVQLSIEVNESKLFLQDDLTFLSSQVEMMRNRGNAWCAAVWLGLFDAQPVDYKDDEKIKEFIIAKYEKKRYHLEMYKVKLLFS